MRRGKNYKRVNITLDEYPLTILKRYKEEGMSASHIIRRALKELEQRRIEGDTITYD